MGDTNTGMLFRSISTVYGMYQKKISFYFYF